MKYFLFFFLLIIITGSCNRKICSNRIDVYEDLYKRYLIILEDSKHPRKLVTPNEINKAIKYLQIVSGIPSKATLNHELSYEEKSDFIGDIKLWKKWYQQNHCEITLQYIDSVLNEVGLEDF